MYVCIPYTYFELFHLMVKFLKWDCVEKKFCVGFKDIKFSEFGAEMEIHSKKTE